MSSRESSRLYYEDGYTVYEVVTRSGDVITIKSKSDLMLSEDVMRQKLERGSFDGPNPFFRPDYDRDIHGSRPQFITSPDVRIPRTNPPGARWDPIHPGSASGSGREQGPYQPPDISKL